MLRVPSSYFIQRWEAKLDVVVDGAVLEPMFTVLVFCMTATSMHQLSRDGLLQGIVHPNERFLSTYATTASLHLSRSAQRYLWSAG